MLFSPTHSTTAAYNKLLTVLDTIEFRQPKKREVHVSWSKVNITPSLPVNMAGYRKREAQSVHDSLYIRFLIFKTPATREHFILLSADLLIFPPDLYSLLLQKLAKIDISADHIYITATHTHSSIGGWSKTFASQLFLGTYQTAFWEKITDDIVDNIQKESQQVAPAQIGYLEIDGRRWVGNRIDNMKPIDDRVRIVKLERADGKVACLANFSAHVTIVDDPVLSADYPGVLVKNLESDSAIDFALFTAGAVGSHSVTHKRLWNFDLVVAIGQSISYEILKQFKTLPLTPLNQIDANRFELPLPKPQLRIDPEWTISASLFESLLGEFKGHINFLKLNNLVFLGLPCDFSGEIAVKRQLYSIAKGTDHHLILSGFNGAYIGYITPDIYYETVNHAEVKEMNWFGPGGERYFSTLILDILTKQK